MGSKLRLNLGCGRVTHAAYVNIDFNYFLKISRIPLIGFFLKSFGVFYSHSEKVLVHDLRRGIPFDSDSADVIYHSHLLEHLDYRDVDAFLREIHRVLKVGGIHRIAIPNFEYLIRQIQVDIDNYDRYKSFFGSANNIHRLLDQSVRKTPARIAELHPSLQRIAVFLFGDAQSRGETHQMMYSKPAIHEILEKNGFSDINFCTFGNSRILDWPQINLDINQSGSEIHPGSIYIECTKNYIHEPTQIKN